MEDMKDMEISKIKLFMIILCVVIFFMFVTFITAYKFNNRLAYLTKCYEETEDIEVKDILREKGKEPIYTIEINGEEVDIPESIYLKHIGDENNSITLRIEELSVFIARDMLGFSFDTSDTISLLRISYPWEGTPQKFSEREIQYTLNEIKKTVRPFYRWSLITYKKLDKLNFNFPFDERRNGVHFTNCLEKGATKYKDSQI